MNFRKTILSVGVASALGVQLLAPTVSLAGIIPGGDYELRINPTPVSTRSTSYGGTETFFKLGTQARGWNSNFTFGNLPGSGSQAMTDNDLLVSTENNGSGLAGDGHAGTINITIVGDAFTVTSFQVDTIFGTAGGNFAQHLNPALTGKVISNMSGTIDGAGNMTFTPTGRLGTIDGPEPDITNRRWNVDDVVDAAASTWDAFTTGTVTSVPGSVTGTQLVNVGPTLNGDAFDDFTAILVNSGAVGRDWLTFAGVAFYEIWKVDIVSVNVTANLPPTTAIAIAQAGSAITSIVQTGGDVTVTANASDNDADPLTYTWTVPTGAVITAGGTTSDDSITFSPAALTVGDVVSTSVSVDDANNPAIATSISAQVVSAPVVDTLGDGIEDSIDRNSADPATIQLSTNASEGNAVHDGTGTLALGSVSSCPGTNVDGIAVTEADVFTSAGVGCTTPGNTTPDTLFHIGGVFDFKITGLTTNEIVKVVLPLTAAIPSFAQYRKYDVNTGWGDFNEAGADKVESAPGSLGSCPPPGDAAYVAGLIENSFCVQLTMQEGGPNDADSTNGTLADPGAVAQGIAPPSAPTQPSSLEDRFASDTDFGCTLSSGAKSNAAGRIDLWLLAGLLTWFRFKRKVCK